MVLAQRALRRPAYTLRTLFVLVTLLCCWLAYSMHWIRQRHEYLSSANYYYEGGRAPLGLWLLGEQGVAIVRFSVEPSEAQTTRAKKLFPEAIVHGRDGEL